MTNKFKKLNEQLQEATKKLNLLESNNYTLDIVVDRDRDNDGHIESITFDAKNDLEALLYVFKKYDLQNSYVITDEDGLTEEQLELKHKIENCVKENKVTEGVKLLTDLYFDNFDISDYYDDICKLVGPTGVVFEDEDLDTDEFCHEINLKEAIERAFLGIDEKALQIITDWYEAEELDTSEFEDTYDLSDFIQEDIYDMLDAATDSEEIAIVKKALDIEDDEEDEDEE